jgi:Zn-dependent protease
MLNQPLEVTLAFLLALIPAFTVHEFAHAWTAYQLGDPTAKNLGRLTLNPLKHLDVLGTLMVLLVGFGWAKPVPVNPANLRRGRGGLALVAIAGPLSNLAMATVVALLWRATGLAGGNLVALVLSVFVWLNVILLFFNLIPVSPLDGFKVAIGWLPEPLASRYAGTAQIGPLVLFGLIILGYFAGTLGLPQLDIIGTLLIAPTNAVVSFLLGA